MKVATPYVNDLYYMTKPFIRLAELKVNSLVEQYGLNNFQLLVIYTVLLFVLLDLTNRIGRFFYRLFGWGNLLLFFFPPSQLS